MQEVIKAKQEAMEMWETSGRQDGRDCYRQANKMAKKAEAQRAMNELYDELETPEGERKISHISKARRTIR